MGMKRSEFVRSVFEGTAFALRHVVETVKESGAKLDLLRICGGGAKSRTWCQIKASMLKVAVYVLDDESGDVPVGDALIVGHKVGVFPNLKEATNKVVKIKEIIQPIKEWSDIYDEMYPYYVEMYKNLDSNLKDFREIMKNIIKK